MFAKLFRSEKYGQILAVRDTDDEHMPCIKVSVQPEGLGVCSTSLQFTDDDKGYDNQEKTFDKMDLLTAETMASAVFDALNIEE